MTLCLNLAKEINNALNQNSQYPKKEGQKLLKMEKGCNVLKTTQYHQIRSKHSKFYRR